MKTEQIIRLLGHKNIKIIDEGNKIYHDERIDINTPLCNHYAIMIINGKWCFCLILLERRNAQEVEIKKSFTVKEDALEYLFLNRLHRYFMDKYVIPNRNLVDTAWDMDTLRSVMRKLDIPERYLCTKDTLIEHSICVYNENNMWYEAYVDRKKQILATSLPDQRWVEDEEWFFSLRLNSIFCLYLLDLYVEELQKQKELDNGFSDAQIVDFLELA